MTGICLVNIWMGPLPKWFRLWRLSAERNPSIDFYIVTDQKDVQDSANVHFLHMEMEEIKRRIEEDFGFSIVLHKPYKLCDYKTYIPAIIPDVVKNYDFWGHVDLDLIFGDVRKFLDQIDLEKYDRIFEAGNLSIYRNTEEINRLYQLSESSENMAYPYKKACKTKYSCYFDEYMGMNILSWQYLKERSFRDQTTEKYIQDFGWQTLDFRSYIHKKSFVFQWKSGKLMRYYTDEKGCILEDSPAEEILLAHIQKREMKDELGEVENIDEFWIVPNAFTAKRPDAPLFDDEIAEAYRLKIQQQDKNRSRNNLKTNGALGYIPHFFRKRRILKFLFHEKKFF